MNVWPAERRPSFAQGVRLARDKARGCWVLLAPERVVVADDSAAAALRLVDGARSVGEIAALLGCEFAAPADVIRSDIAALFAELGDAGLVR